MKHITKEMLFNAVKQHIPILEPGDTFGDDVFAILIGDNRVPEEDRLRLKDRKYQCSNLHPYHDEHFPPLLWITHCARCGKEIRLHIMKTDIFTGTCAIDVVYRKGKDRMAFEYNGRKSYIWYHGFLNFHEHDNAYCEDCMAHVKSNIFQHIKDYLGSNDKFSIWQEWHNQSKLGKVKAFTNSTSWFGRIPYRYFVSSYALSNEDGSISYIQDSITKDWFYEGKVISNEEYCMKINERLKREQNKEQKENKQNSISSQKLYSPKYRYESLASMLENEPQLGLTDAYILKFCYPNNATPKVNDLTDILTAQIDEERVQAHLRMLLYKDFLRTPYWKTIVLRKKFIDGKCTCCGSTNDLECHHKTYEHHGDERHYMNELTTLCKSCHNKIHSRENIERPK